MRNIRLTIEYDGSNFSGWQNQPGLRTVQGELENVIDNITTETVKLIGAGRTDQGVHAVGQVANFQTGSSLELMRMRKAINGLTRDDIYIRKIDEVPDDFHSRYSALSKTYQYKIIYEPLPLLLRYSWHVKYQLDLERINSGIKFLCGTHNFKYFSALTDKPNTACELMQLDLTPGETGCIITIKANRFLHKMARGIVGFMCDIGRNHYQPDDINAVFEGKIKDIYFAPPQGLCLLRVDY